MAKKTIKPQNNEANMQNANKGIPGTKGSMIKIKEIKECN